jgi:hypothetical protein
VEPGLRPLISVLHFLLISGCVLAAGCTTSEMTQTFVKDVTVGGPAGIPPVHVVTNETKNSITLTGYLAFQEGQQWGYVTGSPPGKVSWLYPLDTVRQPAGGQALVRRVPTYNLLWNLPKVAAGLHVDMTWRSTAISFGASLSEASGSTLFGWSAGVGLFGGDSGAVRVRFDAGLSGQAMYFDASSVTISTSTTSWLFGSTTNVDTAYFHDTRSTSALGYYCSFTLNSAVEDWPVNVFLQGSYVVQELLAYSPMTRTTTDWLVPLFLPIPQESSSTEVSTKPALLGVTPGVYVRPSRSLLLLVGVRFMFDVSDTLLDTGRIVIPFVQVSLSFNR